MKVKEENREFSSICRNSEWLELLMTTSLGKGWCQTELAWLCCPERSCPQRQPPLAKVGGRLSRPWSRQTGGVAQLATEKMYFQGIGHALSCWEADHQSICQTAKLNDPAAGQCEENKPSNWILIQFCGPGRSLVTVTVTSCQAV